MSFTEELKRRNVFRVGIAYVVAAWVLLQVTDLVLENIAAPEWVMQVFMLAIAIGLPLVLMFAWAFELTPEGIKREREVDRSTSIAPKTGRKLDRLIIVFLGVAVVILLADRFMAGDPGRSSDSATSVGAGMDEAVAPVAESMAEPGETASDRSIAVLPLANRSSNPEDAYFAEGIHDELLTQLSHIGALRVISRTSVMGYAGTTKRLPEIGRELGVSTLLEGGVQRAGDRVRINVQLIDADTDEHLWAQVYDRELTADNLFDIQSDITRSIASALEAVLSGEEQQSLSDRPTDSVEAYTYYLRGKAESQSYGRTSAEINRTIGAYQAALDLDPGFGVAWAALSTDWSEYFWNTDRLGEERENALAALERARELAPNAPETLTAEGYYRYWGFLDYEAASEAFDQALARAPNHVLALRGRAYVLRRMGRFDESIETLRRIIDLDPLNAQLPGDLGFTLMRVGKFEEGAAMAARSRELDIGNEWNRFSDSRYYRYLGRLDAAIEALGPLRADSSWYLAAYFAEIQLATGNLDGARRALDQLRRIDSPPMSDLWIEGMLVHLDDDAPSGPYVERLRETVTRMTAEYPGSQAALSAEMLLAGFEREAGILRAAVRRFDTELPPDAMRFVDDGQIVFSAYAMAGMGDELVERLETLVQRFGPWELYYAAQMPEFEPYRERSDFQALMGQYEDWAAQWGSGR